MTDLYRLLFSLVLQRIPAERAHALAELLMRAWRAVPGVGPLLRRLLGTHESGLEVRALGMTFPSPLGAAAGLDKNARSFEALVDLGFGFVEVGTVTARRQPGNPGSRVHRLVAKRAIHNRMGFPNDGADEVAARLSRRRKGSIIGVNVGKSRSVDVEHAVGDYRAAVSRLAHHADYLVVNVSSPNTPNLRTLQAVEQLRPLLIGVRSELDELGIERPILVKIGADLTDSEVDAVADLALELSLDGIVAVNTTTDLGVLGESRADAAALGDGGISGRPLASRAMEVLNRLYQRVGDQMVLVSVGGIDSADDAWERILAGATLIQSHTGFVYGGPGWPRHINRGLASRLRALGEPSLDAVRGRAHAGPIDLPTSSEGELRSSQSVDGRSRGAFA